MCKIFVWVLKLTAMPFGVDTSIQIKKSKKTYNKFIISVLNNIYL